MMCKRISYRIVLKNGESKCTQDRKEYEELVDKFGERICYVSLDSPT